MTVWPEVLPLPTFEGYSIESMDSVSRTDMESGPARQRLRYTQTPTRIKVRWKFNSFQFSIFESWFKHEAKEGGRWFEIPLLGGLGMVEHESRFAGRGSSPYIASPEKGDSGGAFWVVSSVLEIRERSILGHDMLDIALTEDVSALFLTIDAFEDLIQNSLYELIED